MHALRYSFSEALRSLWRARASVLLSTATIAGALLICGTFLLVTSNLQGLIASWTSAAELSVYLTDEVTEAERTALERLLADSPLVGSREYVSKSEALVRFNREFGDLKDIAASFPVNPFPASFEVRLRPEHSDANALNTLGEQLRGLKGVADLRYDRRWIERLRAIVVLVTGLAIAFAGILIVGAALTVSNVVRLAVGARRQEIEIMRLVGAPMPYMAGPFLAEGILQGGFGALLALVCLWTGFLVTQQQYGALTTDVLGLAAFRFLSLESMGLLVFGGMIVGCLGAVVATWGALLPRERKITQLEPAMAR